MKILFLIGKLNGIAGGAERSTFLVINELCLLGHEIFLSGLYEEFERDKFVYQLDSRVVILTRSTQSWNRNEGTGGGLASFIKRIVSLRSIILKLDIQIAVPVMHSAIIPSALLLPRVVKVGVEHICIKHYAKKNIQLMLFQVAALFLKKLVFVAPKLSDDYPFPINRKAVVIPNPIDEVFFTKGRLQATPVEKERDSRLKLVSVGRLDDQKDPLVLVYAIHLLLRDEPKFDVTLDIIGEGRLSASVEDLVVTLGLEGIVQLKGKVLDPDEMYMGYDCLVSASLYESFGYVFLEALCYRLPVIVLDDCYGVEWLGAFSPPNLPKCAIVSSSKFNRAQSLAFKIKQFGSLKESGLVELPSFSLQDGYRLGIDVKSIGMQWSNLLTECCVNE